MGVLLSAIGIYGVVAYSLALRRRELGVRIALGANRRQVGRLIYRNGMAPVFVGLFAGLLAATVLTRLIDSLLFEVSALDPTIFGGAALILLVSGVLPCWIITREAARIDPVTAMRLD
jgi:ABC-type antimicrobial peptide transport system permease subunit